MTATQKQVAREFVECDAYGRINARDEVVFSRRDAENAEADPYVYDDIDIPSYDNNGNITRYLDANGNTVAAYVYNAFGKTVSQSGPLADIFRHRFSTKYFDPETGLYYYGYRFYNPSLMRWLNRDPIEEEGGENLYAVCRNGVPYSNDFLGLFQYFILYYEDGSFVNNFKKAAETRKRIIEANDAFNDKCDAVTMFGVKTAVDFVNAWNEMVAITRQKSKRIFKFQAKEVHIYTHAGYGALYFKQSSIYSRQIKKLPSLNWATSATMMNYGCNSGIPGDGNSSVAGSFRDSQQIMSSGQVGSSSFSNSESSKSKWGVILGFPDIYLWAYDDSGNAKNPISYMPQWREMNENY